MVKTDRLHQTFLPDMNYLIENFKKEKSWTDFIDSCKKTGLPAIKKDRFKNNTSSIVAEEDIWPFIISSFFLEFEQPLFILTATTDRAEELSRELKPLNKKTSILIYPGIGNSIFRGKLSADNEILAARFEILRKILEYKNMSPKAPFMIISTINAIIDMLPEDIISDNNNLKIVSGQKYDREVIIENLAEMGYERVNRIYDKGEFSARGDIIDVFDTTAANPIRIDLSQNTIDRILTFDINMSSPDRELPETVIFPNRLIREGEKDLQETSTSDGAESRGPFRDAGDKREISMMTILDFFHDNLKEAGFILCDPLESRLKLKSDLDIIAGSAEDKEFLRKELIKTVDEANDIFEAFDLKLDLFSFFYDDPVKNISRLKEITKQKKSYGNPELFINNIKKDINNKKIIIISTGSSQRIKKISEVLLNHNVSFKNYSEKKLPPAGSLKPGVINILSFDLFSGYLSGSVSVYGELDIYEQIDHVQKEKDIFEGISDTGLFNTGDFVVHKTHGIGKYIEIISEKTDGNKKEYFLIEYANNDRLYVPIWQSDRIHRYVGDKTPAISTLNSRQWDNLKKKVRTSVQKLAVDLARLYAERNTAEGFAFSKDEIWQNEMENLFPFTETSDQKKAIEFVKERMQMPNPMDLLVCGDVGFGKTEVAIRAAFKAIENNKQVLMLVPTTILADQHFRTFNERYGSFPVKVEVISRFRTSKEQKKVIDDFSEGRTDLLIGTHRILSKDIRPRDLGLIIVDEEQRFGVNAKEKIKLLKKEVDVLTLSATPIPRTLYMSLSGVRDIVLIETHPSGRFPIETFVGENDDLVIRNAIKREIVRGGQVYFVHNRINSITERRYKLQVLLPDIRIAVTHGRMEGREIEKVMQDFVDKKFDVLLTTSIIESGMDISNVNTLIVEDSHKFGLSQLYQLRGRVGRSSEKAYAYFFYPYKKSLSWTAFQRLKTLAEYTELGSGYKIAMKDLEIRGSGELLGAKQHGHINSVGFDMYCQIIKEEVGRLKGEEVEEDINIQIEIPVNAYIPKNFIRQENERIKIYRLLADLKSRQGATDIISSIEDRFGAAPEVLKNLVSIAVIKMLARTAGIEKIIYSKERGAIFKKIILDEKKLDIFREKDIEFNYFIKSGELRIKNTSNQPNIGLVLDVLNVIIGFI